MLGQRVTGHLAIERTGFLFLGGAMCRCLRARRKFSVISEISEFPGSGFRGGTGREFRRATGKSFRWRVRKKQLHPGTGKRFRWST
jgi:hypothetical protein